MNAKGSININTVEKSLGIMITAFIKMVLGIAGATLSNVVYGYEPNKKYLYFIYTL